MSSLHSVRRVLRRAAVPAVGAALAIGINVTLATPAAASGSYTGLAYVHGTGGVSDDFDDEGVVNVGTHRSSNVTCLWQTVLWANGYLPSSGIDGIFGDQTDAATRNFQRDKGLGADGSAGRNSWTKAGDKLAQTDNQNGWRYVVYRGAKGSRSSYSAHEFVLQRSPDGNFRFYLPQGGGPYWATYNSRSC
ncbi:peptidoglycan-binding domain-containing protein [Micromonospora chokoriensis]|uniref:Putative peptidoglycan binding domain-containing protein n=1 Tax=Micromonospora chokoriensis TaxID=356851 RepID=A0A1C4VZE2_9ACTN|nr:peptidoglycan-binding domain-containing protein [Micromonospora chokoriensis]SCE89151.1 Putative peptidoglycan binding domain-containing protein [Micromonospora chokoriensis]